MKTTLPSSGVHSGWSNPPPYYYVQNKAPLLTSHYRDFSKQWHHKMLLTPCQDPTFSEFATLNYTYKNPSNTFYPPGVVCAKEFNGELCPTSGESGSPLMTQEANSARYTTQGLLSFVKGCTIFGFGRFPPYIGPLLSIEYGVGILSSVQNVITNTFYHTADNPLVYTKIRCYLPWIAAQYDLEFDGSASVQDDPECIQGSGILDEEEEEATSECSNTPSSLSEIALELELPCIFPFYVDGRLINDTCFKFNADDFLDPVSRCPILNITTKINGINSFNSSDPRLIFGGYCFDKAGSGALDPSLDPVTAQAQGRCPALLTPFSKCKNNCRGGTDFL